MLDIDRFVADCRSAITEHAPEVAIKELLERALAHPAEVEAALGTPQEGQIATLHQSPELTILKVIWTPGLTVYPHDHRMWAIIGLYGGREDNTFYRRAPAGLTVAGDRRLGRGDVALLGQAVIHSVTNPLREFTGAIHIYGETSSTSPGATGTPRRCRSVPTTWGGPSVSSPRRTSAGARNVPGSAPRRTGERGHQAGGRMSDSICIASDSVLSVV